MNYRLIVKYEGTGIVTEQYFPDMDMADLIVNYLDNALENGARLNYLVQKRTKTGIKDMDSNSWDCWYDLPAWHD